jgi:hypothetical protein
MEISFVTFFIFIGLCNLTSIGPELEGVFYFLNNKKLLYFIEKFFECNNLIWFLFLIFLCGLYK